MTPSQLKQRTKTFAVAIVRFARTMPTDPAILVIMRQLVKSGTSVGANSRSSCRAKSRADFVSKMTTAEEEADETLYWLEVLSDAGIVKASTVAACSMKQISWCGSSLHRSTRRVVRDDNQSTIIDNPQIRNPQSAMSSDVAQRDSFTQ
jgi:four helix bundle protein